jgi:hypothetical protein
LSRTRCLADRYIDHGHASALRALLVEQPKHHPNQELSMYIGIGTLVLVIVVLVFVL